jgi:hypothetical protein
VVISIIGDASMVPGFMPAILIRNGFFVLLTVAYLLNLLNVRQRSALAGPG